MEYPYLPLFLHVAKRPCLLVGTGKEAIVKGRMLLTAGASLRVVAPNLDLWPADVASQIQWVGEEFLPEHMDGVWLVVSALACNHMNGLIQAEAERRGIFLNIIDQPYFCSAIWPAVVSRPPISVAISTGGTGPALAAWLRSRIDAVLPENMGAMALWFAKWRQFVSPQLAGLEERGRFWQELFQQGLADRFLQGDEKGAETMIHQSLAKKN